MTAGTQLAGPANGRTAAVPGVPRARMELPEVPRGEISLQPPPLLPKGGNQGATQLMFMLPMMLGMGAMAFTFIVRAGGPMVYIFGALYGGVMVGMVVMALSRGGVAKKAQINAERRDYHRYLSGLRTQVAEVSDRQREALEAQQPPPAGLWSLVDTARLWERSPYDGDFGRIRVAIGPQRLATPLRAPQTAPLEDLDPVSSTALRRFIRTHATVPDLPVAIALRAFSGVDISGPRDQRLDLVRAILAQLVTFHSPTDLRVCVCAAPERLAEWEWTKWLPHAQDPKRQDAVGSARLVSTALAPLADDLGSDLGERPVFQNGAAPDPTRPHIVVIMDGGMGYGEPRIAPEAGRMGVTVLDVSSDVPVREPDGSRLLLHLTGERLGSISANGILSIGRPDALDAAGVEALSRRLTARFVHAPVRRSTALTSTQGLAGLLGIGDPRTTDPEQTWTPRPPHQRLRIPIGVDLDGIPVELDLKESAEGGMGPHGLVIGATGSGKSELLRTLVTGLAVTHSSEVLNLALIDFKGGATFAGMADLPHVSAVITNLADDLALVDRMADAVRGEMVRRQELLREAGNYASARDYEIARAQGADLAPLPSLLVIIDEFSELLSARPEFIDLFVMIGRLGRSLGVHLLLASQRLEEGRLRGLDSHLSYRVGLRTFSASESRAVLGVPDAYELPPLPGSAFLKIDTTTLVRFKAAYVSGALPKLRDDTGVGTGRHQVLPFTLGEVVAAAPDEPAEVVEDDPMARPTSTDQTIMGAMLAPLAGHGPGAYRIWLPPLDAPPTLDELMPALGEDSERGLCPAGWSGNASLVVPLGIVDKPFEQRRDVLWADLSGAAGHLIVVGAPQSGKSTLLRTLITSLALTHTPQEAQFFLLDMSGGLASVAGLPHVSGHATRLEPDKCRRIVAEVMTILTRREQAFAAAGIESVAQFRARREEYADIDEPGRPFGDVFLVIDDWTTLRQEYEKLEEAITTIAGRGLGFGVHVVLSAGRWMGVRANLRDLLGSRLELRLGDAADSAIDRKAAQNVPEGRPGRGLTPDKLHSLIALPRVDSDSDATTVYTGTADLVRRVAAAWNGPPAPNVRLLPLQVPLERLPEDPARRHAVRLGIGESDLAPIWLDFDAEPHLLAFGDVESGKSALLRLVARGITDHYSPSEAAIIVADYRRSLLDVVGGDHLLGYAGSEPALTGLLGEVVQAMRQRLPGPDVTAEQLRTRSWWTGPDLFLLVDDYDLVATGRSSPLAELVPFLPQARDIGLHVVLTRASGGASRALFEPVIQRLRDMGSLGLILSGSKDEGVLLGEVKPSPQPPGRGTLVGRRGYEQLVQLAWTPPPEH